MTDTGTAQPSAIPAPPGPPGSAAGVDLEFGEPAVLGGAVFFTSKRETHAELPLTPYRQHMIGRHRVRLFRHAAAVSFVQPVPARDDLAGEGLELVHRALDLAAITGGRARALPEADDQHVTWWRDAGGPTLRLLVTSW